MNDNALIAAVLREVAQTLSMSGVVMKTLPDDLLEFIFDTADRMRQRAAELDPPEKNEAALESSKYNHATITTLVRNYID